MKESLLLGEELAKKKEKLEKIKGYWAETPFSLDRPVNDEDGRKFIDFVLSREVEAKLAAADGAQIPLRAGVAKPEHVLDIAKLTLIPVDWTQVGEQISTRMEQLKGRFLQ